MKTERSEEVRRRRGDVRRAIAGGNAEVAGELCRELEKLGLQVAVSQITCSSGFVPHCVIRRGKQQVLHVWPSSGSWWNPQTRAKGKVTGIGDVLALLGFLDFGGIGAVPAAEELDPPPGVIAGVRLEGWEMALVQQAMKEGCLKLPAWAPVASSATRAWQALCERQNRPCRIEDEAESFEAQADRHLRSIR